LNNPEFSGKPQNSSSSSANSEDIPAALRDTPDVAPKTNRRLIFTIGGILGFVLMAVLSGYLFYVISLRKTADSKSSPANSPNTAISQPGNSVNTEANQAAKDTVLGHISYKEAPDSELVAIFSDGRIQMRKAAAAKYEAMVTEARKAGVNLVAISAFRSVKDQNQLFFGVSAQRNQTPAERAALSAPPGYSEHHTGYAVDIGDAAVPAANLSEMFEKTKAYQWLEANAARFSFELSFPKNNPQGVSYEPWHWRFVGDTDSLETFYRAKNVKPVKGN
jgi:D-alanyl-D-alanine carboxypeptidase